MADTFKDKRKALVKKGDAPYVRNNPRGKYSRTEKHAPEVKDLENVPPVKEGFWKTLAKGIFGL